METLASHLAGRWQSGSADRQSTLANPTTGEAVAVTSTAGLDLGEALDFARTRGGATLRAMSFTQRGALLLAMSKAIHGAREELLQLATLNGGNTRSDAKFDIDGATHTLSSYAQLGETLGERGFLLDGDPINIGRSGRYQGQHVLMPMPGVAVHINAFNFPAWGFAEKAACAILSGMPVLCKPATSTALVTWRMFQVLEEAKVMPEGVASLLCGSAGDLLDHLGWADVVAFTGSSDTARTIRQHPRVISEGVRVNVEADSLNAAVLGEETEDNTYDAFIRDVCTDMTQKTGQKCTAIRRVFVPDDRIDEVIEDLGERLARTVVGDPSRDDVRMGPVATKTQHESVREGIALLRAEADVAWGSPEGGDFVGIEPGQGYFVSPLLLKAHGGAKAVHQHEVFGPVATLVPYDGSATDAVDKVARGGGGLVASVYADDRKYAQQAVLGIAPYHGRVTVTDTAIADKTVPPGTVLPILLHGGPGRAGGGEELGGERGMRFYLQRSALQGNGPLLARYVGA